MLKDFLYQLLLMDINLTASKENCYCYLWNLGMEIIIFADIAKADYQKSRNIIESLIPLHLEQSLEENITSIEENKQSWKIISRKKTCNVIKEGFNVW